MPCHGPRGVVVGSCVPFHWIYHLQVHCSHHFFCVFFMHNLLFQYSKILFHDQQKPPHDRNSVYYGLSGSRLPWPYFKFSSSISQGKFIHLVFFPTVFSLSMAAAMPCLFTRCKLNFITFHGRYTTQLVPFHLAFFSVAYKATFFFLSITLACTLRVPV